VNRHSGPPQQYERSTTWAATVESFAVCPIVEGALVRFLLRLGESAATATEVLNRIPRIAVVRVLA
jgi:hypothetical protein